METSLARDPIKIARNTWLVEQTRGQTQKSWRGRLNKNQSRSITLKPDKFTLFYIWFFSENYCFRSCNELSSELCVWLFWISQIITRYFSNFLWYFSILTRSYLLGFDYNCHILSGKQWHPCTSVNKIGSISIQCISFVSLARHPSIVWVCLGLFIVCVWGPNILQIMKCQFSLQVDCRGHLFGHSFCWSGSMRFHPPSPRW